MNLLRISSIASNVFREVIRDRVLYLIGLYALTILFAARFIPELAASTENKIILDIGLGSMGILGLIVTVFVSTGLVNKEIEKRTVYVLVAKPITRTELIIGKHLGLSALLAVLIGIMTIFLMLILSYNRIPYYPTNILLSSLFMWVELSLITAVGILFGVFTSSLLATLLTIGIYFMGNASRDLVTLGKLTKNVDLERMMTGLYLILPDLARLNLKNDAVYGVLPSAPNLAINFGYGIIYIILLLTISTMVFSRREF
jgi:ABC-type transport system involved in multi-copper enzyme maturation permease subunit